MMQITAADYFMGRDVLYPDELTAEITSNARTLVERVNALLAEMSGVPMEVHPNTLTLVVSGWRPPQINSQVKGAAPKSKHMTGQAVDLYDPEGELDYFCMEYQNILSRLKLWMENPACTKSWCHLQSVSPRSGQRVFYP